MKKICPRIPFLCLAMRAATEAKALNCGPGAGRLTPYTSQIAFAQPRTKNLHPRRERRANPAAAETGPETRVRRDNSGPTNTGHRKRSPCGYRGSGSVFAEPGFIHNQRSGLQLFERAVVFDRSRHMYLMNRNIGLALLEHGLDFFKHRRGTGRYEYARRSILALLLPHQVPSLATAEPSAPMQNTSVPVTAKRQVGSKSPSAYTDAAGSFTTQQGFPRRMEMQLVSDVNVVEHVATDRVQAQLMGRDECACRVRTVANEPDSFVISFRLIVRREVHPEINAPSNPRCFAHSGNTFITALWVVVTPMNWRLQAFCDA